MKAKCVVLAAGGFQANPEMRTRYLGPLWELAKIRGTRFNTGDGIKMALDIGAMPTGHWSGGHAVGGIVMPPQSAISPSVTIFRSTRILRRHDQCQWRALRRRRR